MCAFLNACAERQDSAYRYLFTLLGSELASNAIRHSRSGERFGYYTLTCVRLRDGLRLTCNDQGVHTSEPSTPDNPHYLAADPNGLNPNIKAGRGLALINALASEWGDNGLSQNRQVWFRLPYDLSDNPWNHF